MKLADLFKAAACPSSECTEQGFIVLYRYGEDTWRVHSEFFTHLDHARHYCKGFTTAEITASRIVHIDGLPLGDLPKEV